MMQVTGLPTDQEKSGNSTLNYLSLINIIKLSGMFFFAEALLIYPFPWAMVDWLAILLCSRLVLD